MKSIIEVYNQGQKECIINDVVIRDDGDIWITVYKKKKGRTAYSYEEPMPIERFVSDYRNVYKVIETVSKDKETRDDFHKYLESQKESQCIKDFLCMVQLDAKNEAINLVMPYKAGKGYWEEYLIKRFEEDCK